MKQALKGSGFSILEELAALRNSTPTKLNITEYDALDLAEISNWIVVFRIFPFISADIVRKEFHYRFHDTKLSKKASKDLHISSAKTPASEMKDGNFAIHNTTMQNINHM